MIQRKFPRYLAVLNGVKLHDAVDTMVFTYKEFMRKNGRSVDYLNIRGRHANYKKIFVYGVLGLCRIIYATDETVRLSKLKLIRLFFDYFTALKESSQKRGHDMFVLKMVSSVYSFEVFQEWCEQNYFSVYEYVSSGLKLQRSPEIEYSSEAEEEVKFDKAFSKAHSGLYTLDI